MRTITKESAMIQHMNTTYLQFKSDNLIYWLQCRMCQFITLEKLRLLSTCASIIIGKMLNQKPQFRHANHNFQPHAKLTLTRQIKKTENFIFR